MGLNQAQFGQLLGAHPVTVSRWETSVAEPTPYQLALLQEFGQVVERKSSEELEGALKGLLVGAGIVAALYFLMRISRGGS